MPAQKLPFNYVFLAFCLLKINKTAVSYLSEQKQQHHVAVKAKPPKQPSPLGQLLTVDARLPCFCKWKGFQNGLCFIDRRTQVCEQSAVPAESRLDEHKGESIQFHEVIMN